MSQDLHTPLSSRLRQPLDSVDNEALRQASPGKSGSDILKISKFSGSVSQISAENYDDCDECKANLHRAEALQIALIEVIEQNEVLKTRVAELEAELNAAHSELENMAGRRTLKKKKTSLN